MSFLATKTDDAEAQPTTLSDTRAQRNSKDDAKELQEATEVTCRGQPGAITTDADQESMTLSRRKWTPPKSPIDSDGGKHIRHNSDNNDDNEETE